MRMVQKEGTGEGVFANDESAEERVLANEEGRFARRRTCSRCASARASGGERWARVRRAGRCGCVHGLCARRVQRALIVNGQRRTNGVCMEGFLSNQASRPHGRKKATWRIGARRTNGRAAGISPSGNNSKS